MRFKRLEGLSGPMAAAVAVAVICCFGVAPAHAEETLIVKVRVLLKVKPDQAPRPFADVGGFLMKRSSVAFNAASCPDLSNGNGEVTCRIKCESKDSDMRLQLFAPAREQARIVAGLTAQPFSTPIEIGRCLIATKLPIEIVYKTAEVLLSEIRVRAPDVMSALTEPNKPLVFKPFATVSAQMRELANNEANRQALLDIGRVAEVQQELLKEQTPKWALPESNPSLVEYAIGTKSVALQALVVQAAGGSAQDWVKLSSKATDLYASVDTVKNSLDKKAVLNTKEIQLSAELRQFKKSQGTFVNVGPSRPNF